jgi:hypothetical protein
VSGHLDADTVLRRRVGESQGSQFVVEDDADHEEF